MDVYELMVKSSATELIRLNWNVAVKLFHDSGGAILVVPWRRSHAMSMDIGALEKHGRQGQVQLEERLKGSEDGAVLE